MMPPPLHRLRFSAVTFSDFAYVEFALLSNVSSAAQDVMTAINRTEYHGGRTYTADAFLTLVRTLERLCGILNPCDCQDRIQNSSKNQFSLFRCQNFGKKKSKLHISAHNIIVAVFFS